MVQAKEAPPIQFDLDIDISMISVKTEAASEQSENVKCIVEMMKGSQE